MKALQTQVLLHQLYSWCMKALELPYFRTPIATWAKDYQILYFSPTLKQTHTYTRTHGPLYLVKMNVHSNKNDVLSKGYSPF